MVFLFVSCFGCFVCVPLNRGAEVMFLVVCGKMTIQQNDDVRPRRLFPVDAASVESRGGPKVAE
jgi:hypothetical protein